MAIFNLNLNNNNIIRQYKNLIKNIYMIVIIFLVFHILINLTGNKLNLNGNLFNCNVMEILIILLLSYMAYELVFKELIQIF